MSVKMSAFSRAGRNKKVAMRSISKRYLFFLFYVLLLAGSVYAEDSMLFLESQMVYGYSSLLNSPVYYSLDSEHAEQKPSVGIEYRKRYTLDNQDLAGWTFQGRFAHDDANDTRTETQIYDAYFDYKFWFADIWAGHNRPAYGLNTILDTHQYLLQTLSAEGIGFERDWGGGVYTRFGEADLNITFTSGSGYMLDYSGNYLINTRISYGILNKDNYTAGVSFANGQIYDMVDYHRLRDNLCQTTSGGMDFSMNIRKWEFKFETSIGNMSGNNVNGTLVRVGYNLLAKNRLKLEVQPVFVTNIDNGTYSKIYCGASYTFTDNLAFRAMYEYNGIDNDHSVVGQLYFHQRV